MTEHPREKPRSRLKTYSHLQGQRRLPSEYELLTTELLYYPRRGFEVEVPLAEWYQKYQRESRFVCDDWERFADPRETTYARYTAIQKTRESFVDGILSSVERSPPAAVPGWMKTLERAFSPLRYPFHGFQMISAYIAQMAPSGRITVAALFQSADEMRRVQRIAYRAAQLRQAAPDFAAGARELWQRELAWQPLREAVERLLVAYDWGEAFAGLALCVKPLVDELFMVELAAAARRAGDYPLGEILSSLDEDCRWHRAWSAALVRMALSARPDNRGVLSEGIARWRPLGLRAVQAAAPLFGDAAAAAAVDERHRAWLAELGQ
jgi:toluene monooxygenase system protein E